MKLLLKYLQPYKWLVILILGLAAMNTGFSLIDPILFGKLVNLANAYHVSLLNGKSGSATNYFDGFTWEHPGVWFIIICSINLLITPSFPKK
jgi:ATP-binding cassette subfamily B protein